MREGVQQDIAQARIARFRRFQASSFAPLGVSFSESLVVQVLYVPIYPRAQCIFTKLQKDALASHLSGRHPGGPLTRERHTPLFGKLYHFSEIPWRLNTCEAHQSPHLAQPFNQHHLFEYMLIARRRRNGSHLEITGRGSQSWIAQYLPLWCLQAERRSIGICLSGVLHGFHLLPDLRICVGSEVCKLADLPQQLDILLAGHFAQYKPVFFYKLTELVNSIGNGQRREHQREPAVGGS